MPPKAEAAFLKIALWGKPFVGRKKAVACLNSNLLTKKNAPQTFFYEKGCIFVASYLDLF